MDEKIGSILYIYGSPKDKEAQEFDIQNLYSWCTWDIVKNDDVSYFEYTDEEGQTIKGETEREWNAALAVAKTVKDFSIDVFTSEKHYKKSLKESCCKPNKKGPTTTNENCCKSKDDPPPQQLSSLSCSDKEGCCPMYERECPALPEDDGKPYIKKVNPDLDQYKYAGDALVAVTLPLGPMGGGSISVAGDGGLRQWQISNKVNHVGHVPNSFFAIKVDQNPPMVLQSSTNYDLSKFKPAAYITDHVVPAASKYLLSKVPGVETIEVTAKYPVVEVEYTDKKLNGVGVKMDAWSPKIPQQSRESAIPTIFYEFTVTNPGNDAIEVSLLGSLQNIIGWDGRTEIANEVGFTGYGGNTNSLISKQNLHGLKMSNPSLTSSNQFNGCVSIFCLPEEGDKRSSMMQYDHIEMLWKAFQADSYLPGEGIAGVSPNGSTFNGAINLTRSIASNSSTTYKFAIAWHFPNRIKDWSFCDTIPKTPVNIGTYYSNVWKTIDDVINEAVSTYADRRISTYQFRDTMFNSTLPWQVIDSVAGRISVLNSPTCMWHADGNMYAFEGCSEQSGCCPLNCTHVWNYEMSLAYLYPDVERTMRNIDLLHNITPHGVVPSRTPCPLEVTRQWNSWKNYTIDPASTYVCVDGEIGTVLKVYRELRNGGDKKWFDDLWPAVKLLMSRWLDVLDEKKEGMIYGPQPNTYDRTVYGYNVFIGLLYLCALKAAAVMAGMQGDTDFATKCSDRFELGSKNLDKACYNGKWYVQVVDPNHQTQLMSDATIIGVMYGQWWAHVLDLGYLLPKDHIQSHLLNTYQRNYVDAFDPATQSPRHFGDKRDKGWITAVWDEGETPKVPLLHLQEMAWSGVVYPFATLLLLEGCTEQGIHMLEVTRQFYDGTRRSPWNEIECGDHYARSMSSFTLLTLISGQKCSSSSVNDSLLDVSFNPVVTPENYKGFFIFPTCWGTYEQRVDVDSKHGYAKLHLSHGEMALKSFSMKHLSQTIGNVSVGERVVSFQASKSDTEGYKKVGFKNGLQLKAGDILTLTFSMQQ